MQQFARRYPHLKGLDPVLIDLKKLKAPRYQRYTATFASDSHAYFVSQITHFIRNPLCRNLRDQLNAFSADIKDILIYIFLNAGVIDVSRKCKT
ncbi:hypothetical protein [Pectobacterium sp. A5351]|uniref:hypothetical protein n=1 Tax=Pectobacterium sp. A5351 TaxID=2914983 RepID=UPI00232C4A55|nr:hypothetical protein [Pectobacterium sp. A5351]WCG85158.1 hypothetical protein O1Q74_18305 [Pectobacterium sp. A5351]